MHGQKEISNLPRLTVMIAHSVSVALIVWLLLTGYIGLPEMFAQATPERRLMIAAFAIIYLIRTLFGMQVLLKRRFSWLEAVIVFTIFSSSHAIFAGLALMNPQPLSATTLVLALALFAIGSYLNTASEYQRYRWKQRPENHGHVHTGGLFGFATHINYFGDAVMFSGYAMATGSPFAFLIPLYMTAGFVFQHIPQLDARMSEKYGPEFDAYAARTKKLVPYIY